MGMHTGELHNLASDEYVKLDILTARGQWATPISTLFSGNDGTKEGFSIFWGMFYLKDAIIHFRGEYPNGKLAADLLLALTRGFFIILLS